MEQLQITRQKDTLGVHCDPETGVVSLEGESYPENPTEFFAPLYAWLKQYTQAIARPLAVNVTISYLNTSSSKCILDLFETLEDYHKSGGTVTLNWYYDDDDEGMQETGEELCEDLALPYTLIPC
jgi:hypothetical protein